MVRTNQRLFMNKEIYKTLMVRAQTKKYITEGKTIFSREAYNKQRNYWAKLTRAIEIEYFGNLNVKKITDKKYCKTVGLKFSSKITVNEKISLLGKID